MDDAMPPAAAPPGSEAELGAVDEALAASLLEQGEAGARALGLLRDAYRMLGEEGYERPAEIAESCVRGAVDALLSLPGSQGDRRPPSGLRGAALALLKAVDAYQPPRRNRQRGRAEASAVPVTRRRLCAASVRQPRHCAPNWSGRAGITGVG